MMSQLPDGNTFRILVSTDNHLGYKETHPIRANDSFDAFEEVIEIAKASNVDFLLLGGDLFHELNPSQRCMFKCVSLLEKNIFGDRPINFITNKYKPNYSNENMNIELPIFIIHGNHDYPATEENISALDILRSCNLINYFGKQNELDNIIIEPVLLEKGPTKIALYGLGHIKDIKLHQYFERDQVKFTKPPSNDYFCILVVHQNRFKGMRAGTPFKNCIHPKMLPNFMSLVIWGHEHESIPDIIENSEQGFYIYQPGSSTATSLIQAEAEPKHAGIIEIKSGEFVFKPIYLKRARPLLYKSIELKEYFNTNSQRFFSTKDNETKEAIVAKKLEVEIEEMIKKYSEEPRESKLLPLVRVKVEYTGFDIVRVRNIEAKFQGKVANEGEILKFWKKVVHKPKNEGALLHNSRLTSRFEETILNKESFGALQTDANESIREIFQQLLQEERKQPRLIQLSTFFDHIPEINIKNSYQKVADLIRESDLSRELIVHLSKDFAQTTNNFVNGASQLIETNYDETQAQGERLKSMDKEYDVPFQNLKTNIMEFTQEIGLRPDTSSKPSANKDDPMINLEEEPEAPKPKATQNRKKGNKLLPEDVEEDIQVITYKTKNPKKSPRNDELEEEKTTTKRMGKLRIEDEPKYKFGGFVNDEEEEDPEANIFDDEFGRPISKGASKPTTSRNSTQTSNLQVVNRDDYESEPSAEKGRTKRKEPGTQKAEVAASQGKRVRQNVSQVKGTGKQTIMDFF